MTSLVTDTRDTTQHVILVVLLELMLIKLSILLLIDKRQITICDLYNYLVYPIYNLHKLIIYKQIQK